MSKPGKVLKAICKKMGVRLTFKRGQKRVYKSVAVLKRQCKNKKKKKKVKKKVKRRRRRKFGSVGDQVMNMSNDSRTRTNNPLRGNIFSYMGEMNMNEAIQRFNRARDFIQQKMAIPGGIRKNLQGADLVGAVLREANFRRANLQGAHLRGANLRHANLERANLRGAHLLAASLTNANLQRANLQGANLALTDLRSANLRGADLRGAELFLARLRGALYNNDTQFPEGFNPEERDMLRRAGYFGKKKRRKVKKKKKSKK